MKYRTVEDKRMCMAGWPKEIGGYPHCDLTPSQMNLPIAPVTPELFTYCCPPAPVKMAEVSGIQRRSNYRNNVPKPRGVHSYYNVMWDGRVHRGDPLIRSLRKETEECEKIRSRLNRPRVGKTFSELKAEAKAAAEADSIAALGNIDNKSRGNLAVSNPTTLSATQAELLRYSQLGIANLCPKEPEKYLKDLNDEIEIDEACYKGRRLQTLRTFPIAPSRKQNIANAETQVLPGDFYDFLAEATPIIQKLIGEMVEQARLEVLEEEELAAYLSQQERFNNRKVEDAKKTAKLKEREEKIATEKERLEREGAGARGGGNRTAEQAFYEACTVGGTVSKTAIAACMESLRKEARTAKDEQTPVVEGEVVDWLNEAVADELKQQTISRNFLDALIIDVVSKREAEYAEAIWREVYAEDAQKKLNNEGFVPPTPASSYGEEGAEDLLGTSDYFNEGSDEF